MKFPTDNGLEEVYSDQAVLFSEDPLKGELVDFSEKNLDVFDWSPSDTLGTYMIEHLQGKDLPHSWNVQHLKKCSKKSSTIPMEYGRIIYSSCMYNFISL